MKKNFQTSLSLRKMILITLLLAINFSVTITINPYKVLHLPSYCTFKQIKERYKEYAKKYHPDRHRSSKDYESIQKKFREINEAYEMLKTQRKTKDEDEDDNHIITLLIESVFIVVGIIIYSIIQSYILAALIWVVEAITSILVVIISVFHICDRFLGHYFDEEEIKIGFVLIVSVVILILKKFYFGKKKVESKEN